MNEAKLNRSKLHPQALYSAFTAAVPKAVYSTAELVARDMDTRVKTREIRTYVRPQ